MTKRRLYAFAAAVLLATGWPLEAGQTACASCVAITIPAGQALLLPADLAGMTVLVRAPGAGDPALAAVVREIAVRNGRAGVLLDPVLAAMDRDTLVFRVRTELTQLRSELGSQVVLALRLTPQIRPAIDALASYADVIVSDAPVDGVRLWPLFTAETAGAAIALTARGGAEQWVVATPPDALQAHALIRGLVQERLRPREGFLEDVEVRGARRLTVEEIVARHQATVRRQSAAVSRTISSGVLTITFEAPAFPAPVTISTDTIIYTDRERTELEQRRVRVNGIEFRGGGVPRLPILEPERVAAPPLVITLSNVYRYRLEADDTVDGIRCYVVAFEPVDSSRALFKGRAWIAMDSFAMVRVAAAQTALRGAIVSSEQVDEFREVRSGIWLLVRSDVRQIYEGAAHRTPIHRLLVLTAHDIEPADFEARRAAAYASDAVMLRDTAEGFRYLRREPPRPGVDTAPVVTVTNASTRVRTLAGGVIIDPNISRPLPFAGISYVDFDLFRTGTQLNAFFGGAYGQLAFSVPSIRKTRWQLAGRAFGIATSYNDRSFRAGREIYEENVRQRPAHASAWLLRPLSPRLSFRAGYDLDYTRLRAAPETAPGFIVPSDQVVHGLRVALEGQRAGWAASLWWNGASRAGWRPWGRGIEFRPAHRDFQRYGLTVSRSTAVTNRVTSRIEGQWMDGRDLDRFSRYAFGTFDNRLRGYPSALVRYDRGAVFRGAIAWSVGKLARVDGFLDTAAVEDPGFGRRFRNYTGVGAAAEIPAPFGMLAAVEWGYGFRGVNANGETGTHVIRVSAFKIF